MKLINGFSRHANDQKKESTEASTNKVHPDVVACHIAGSTSTSLKVTVFYSNRCIFVWDATNPKKVGKYRSFQAHGNCIWAVDVLPSNISSKYPEGTFVTCSTDGSIRFWNLDLPAGTPSTNVYSKELIECISGLGALSKELKFDIISMPKNNYFALEI